MNFDFDCGEIYLYANEEMMKQVWINLLDNAIKFSPEGGTIAIRIQRMTNSLLFSISNESEYISQESLNHIFDKFYQADRSRSTNGNGIGLSITKKIIELHDGTITADEMNDSIIRFHISIPNATK